MVLIALRLCGGMGFTSIKRKKKVSMLTAALASTCMLSVVLLLLPSTPVLAALLLSKPGAGGEGAGAGACFRGGVGKTLRFSVSPALMLGGEKVLCFI